MRTPTVLSSDDWCRRQAHLLERWETPALGPKEILIESIAHGLTTDESASDYAMELAASKSIDTAETDLLGLAEHIAALAEILAWVIRGESAPWERPDPVEVGNGIPWHSSAYLGLAGAKLRQFIVTDRLDAFAELSIRHSWAVLGECAVYGTGMDVIVVTVGNLRQGRWSCPFTRGYTHPVNSGLRFKKRDGSEFTNSWGKVWREQSSVGLEEWYDAMCDDGVVADALHVLEVDHPENAEQIVNLAVSKLERIGSQDTPEMQLSRCFDRIRPCPFRMCCPRCIDPSEEAGFQARLPQSTVDLQHVSSAQVPSPSPSTPYLSRLVRR